MNRIAGAVGAGVLGTATLSAASPVKAHAAATGIVRARIIFTIPRPSHHYVVRLTIDRAGRRVFDKRVAPVAPGYETRPQGVGRRKPISLRDLDSDGEPEVLLDFYSGGAHCCVWSRIFRWIGVRGTYASIARLWGNVDYGIADLDSDGYVEFVSADDRFAYAFTSYAASSLPLQIWTYRSGHLVDTTRAFSAEVAEDAERQWGRYRSARRDHADVRGFLGAWVADECLLDRGDAAFRTLRLLPRGVWKPSSAPQLRSPAAYLTYLRRFLDRTGYDC